MEEVIEEKKTRKPRCVTKPYKISPTLRQKKAHDILVRRVKKGETPTMKSVLIEAGYSKSFSARVGRTTNARGWLEIVNKHDPEPVMDVIYEDCFDTDKRNATDNRKLFLTVTNRMPKNETKVVGFFEKIGEDFKKDDEPRISEENQLPAPSGTDESSGMPE